MLLTVARNFIVLVILCNLENAIFSTKASCVIDYYITTQTRKYSWLYPGDTICGISVIVGGNAGNTSSQDLKPSLNNSKPFQFGQLDTFIIRAVDVGNINQLTLNLDCNDGWGVVDVVISVPSTGQICTFTLGSWLSNPPGTLTYASDRMNCVQQSPWATNPPCIYTTKIPTTTSTSSLSLAISTPKSSTPSSVITTSKTPSSSSSPTVETPILTTSSALSSSITMTIVPAVSSLPLTTTETQPQPTTSALSSSSITTFQNTTSLATEAIATSTSSVLSLSSVTMSEAFTTSSASLETTTSTLSTLSSSIATTQASTITLSVLLTSTTSSMSPSSSTAIANAPITPLLTQINTTATDSTRLSMFPSSVSTTMTAEATISVLSQTTPITLPDTSITIPTLPNLSTIMEDMPVLSLSSTTITTMKSSTITSVVAESLPVTTSTQGKQTTTSTSELTFTSSNIKNKNCPDTVRIDFSLKCQQNSGTFWNGSCYHLVQTPSNCSTVSGSHPAVIRSNMVFSLLSNVLMTPSDLIYIGAPNNDPLEYNIFKDRQMSDSKNLLVNISGNGQCVEIQWNGDNMYNISDPLLCNQKGMWLCESGCDQALTTTNCSVESEIVASTQNDCSIQCAMVNWCAGFNFQSSTKTCQLLTENSSTQPIFCIAGWSYYERL